MNEGSDEQLRNYLRLDLGESEGYIQLPDCMLFVRLQAEPTNSRTDHRISREGIGVGRSTRVSYDLESDEKLGQKENVRSYTSRRSDPMADLARDAVKCLLEVDHIEDRTVRDSLLKIGFKPGHVRSILRTRSDDVQADLVSLVQFAIKMHGLDQLLTDAMDRTTGYDVKSDLSGLIERYERLRGQMQRGRLIPDPTGV